MLTISYYVRDGRTRLGFRAKEKRYTSNAIDLFTIGYAALCDPKRQGNLATVFTDGGAFSWILTDPTSWVTTIAEHDAYIESLNARRKEAL